MSELQKITTEQMDAVGVVSAPDVLSGTPSENKSIFDKMVRQLVAPAYNQAVDAINSIEQTETGIQAAEAERVQAETERQKAEAERARAEAERVEAEANRKEAVTGYVQQATHSAALAENWAVGGTGIRIGEDTNNAKYWAQQAQHAAGGGVTSFANRSGVVVPQAGDYTAEMVEAADRQLSNLDTPQTALYNLGSGVRPNLLTNAYFANPVNQRGRTSYTEKNAPCIDRWRTLGGDSTVTLTESGLQISGAGPYIWSLAQILQDDVKSAITGETVTISVLHSKGLDSVTIEKALSREFSQTFTDGVSLWLSTSGQFFIGADDTKILYAAKLERGNIQTLAYQDEDGTWRQYETQDYGTELAKCQRYFQILDVVWATSGGAQTNFLSCDLRYKMRAAPTVSVGGIYKSDGTEATGVELVSTQCTDNSLYVIQVSVTQPENTWLQLRKVTLSAEL